jgi:SAM-dependent methyltransferase
LPNADYDRYVRLEWDLYQKDPSRRLASLDAARTIDVARVLDVGCGAGQELLPFVADRQAVGVGLDIAADVGRVGRQLFSRLGIAHRIAFVRGSAESMPCRSGIFDVVICRVALPYMDNGRALSEFARVLRPGGRLLLKIHHARFYFDEIWQGIKAFDWRPVAHGGRVLIAGSMYYVTGVQPRNRWVGSESFQTERLLRRELTSHRLAITSRMPDFNAMTPSFVIVKESDSPGVPPA